MREGSGISRGEDSGFRYFYIRTSGSTEQAERALSNLYPDLSFISIATFYGFPLHDIVSAMGLLLMSGVLLSLAPLRRTHEIGIRRAVGASQARILRRSSPWEG